MNDLPPELDDLFAAERGADTFPAERQAALASRLSGTLGVPLAQGSAAAKALGAGLKSHILVGVLAFAAGGGTVAALRRPEVRVEVRYVERTAAPAPADPSAPSRGEEPAAPVAAPSASEMPRAIASAPTPARATASPASSDLAAERAEIEAARAALARGRADDALAAVSRHRKRFPRGQLAEERDALEVQALVAKGALDEARRAGTRFGKEHPSSMSSAAVDHALRSIP